MRSLRRKLALPGRAMSSAQFSQCGKYRYRLERNVGKGPTVVAIMVNPSTADAQNDDPTIRRVMGFARANKWGKVIIVNKFALITPYIRELGFKIDPVGPENDHFILESLLEADICVVAWGSLAKLPPKAAGRWRSVSAMLNALSVPIRCWGINKDGHPKHPLYLARGSELVEWTPPSD